VHIFQQFGNKIEATGACVNEIRRPSVLRIKYINLRIANGGKESPSSLLCH